MDRRIIGWIAAFFVALAFVWGVSAAGVSTQVWEENHLKAYPGQEGVIPIYLQNMVGEEDLIFTVQYEDNPLDMTDLDETEYDVPLGTYDTLVELKFKIPEDVAVGETYNVRLLFDTRSRQAVEGGIRTNTAYGRVFPIDIVPKEEVQPSPVAPAEPQKSESYTFVWYLAGVLVIAGVVVYFVMRRKK